MKIVCQACGHHNLHNTIVERFWNQVDKSSSNRSQVGQEKNCWEWVGNINSKGYGVMSAKELRHLSLRTGKSANERVHRVAYILANGPIDDGMLVRHKCDNSYCVRHDHLELGTHYDNMQDAKIRGRMFHGESAQAKLTKELVQEIRRDHPTLSYRKLATKYGVGTSTIGCIIRGEIWKDYTLPH